MLARNSLAVAVGLSMGLGLAATGCAADTAAEDDAVESTAEPIKGGYSDSKDNGVVGVFNAQIGALCSGSLLAPNMVLTAHHCVANIKNEVGGGVDCSKTGFSAPFAANTFYVTTHPTMTMNPSDYHTVKEVRLPQTSPLLCGADQAILILEDNVEASEAAPLVPRVDTPILPKDAYHAIGYGGTDNNGSGAGQRRRLDHLAIDCVGTACKDTQIKKAEFEGDTGICEGDSGGPALDEKNRVIGVTSRGGANCTSPIYGYVYGWKEWVIDSAKVAAKDGNYPVPSWAQGTSTDPTFAYPIGAACSAPKDCPSGYCLNSYCTRLCDAMDPCSDGYDCVVQDGKGICTKPEPAQPDMPMTSTDDTLSDTPNETKSGCSVSAESTSSDAWAGCLSALGVALLFARRRRS